MVISLLSGYSDTSVLVTQSSEKSESLFPSLFTVLAVPLPLAFLLLPRQPRIQELLRYFHIDLWAPGDGSQ